MINNEKGSATIEFLGMLPFVFLIMVIFWQFLVAAYAVIVSESAVNEAAKIYAVTENIEETRKTTKEFIKNAGGNLEFVKIDPPIRDKENFELTLEVKFHLKFLPDFIEKKVTPITFTRSINGRVME